MAETASKPPKEEWKPTGGKIDIDPQWPEFVHDKHVEYIIGLDDATESFAYWVTEHLRMSGVYWGLSAMSLMSSLDRMDKQKGIDFVKSCQKDNGGFSGNVAHDPHLLYTLSAIQVLTLFDALDAIDTSRVVAYVKSLQREDGAFCGDEWGEASNLTSFKVDTRFCYCAINCLSLLNALDSIDIDKTVNWIVKCKNFDGAFGCVPDAESHAGQTFCCVAALAITGKLEEHVDRDLLGWWLAERQVECGGLNGRPEKKEDVCYSWWVLSALSILHRVHWIDEKALINFILTCQDEENGGISDRPGDMVDVFHTFFGVAGLSFLHYPGLEPIDPAFALPLSTLQRMKIQTPWMDE